jgi:hypothetical protein
MMQNKIKQSDEIDSILTKTEQQKTLMLQFQDKMAYNDADMLKIQMDIEDLQETLGEEQT